MIFLVNSTAAQQPFQQPPTSSGLSPSLDWAVFISLLFLIVVVGFRQILKSGNADQKVLETLINETLKVNASNSDKLSELVGIVGKQQSEEASVVFRLRNASDQLNSISQSIAQQQLGMQLLEREISAIHRRLDLSGAPHSSETNKET